MSELKNDSLANQIVTEAIEWLGTPWFHGQSLKGIGTDCVGFIAGVGIKVGFLPYDFILENYERIPRNNFLVKLLDRLLDRVEGDLCKGDVLMCCPLRFWITRLSVVMRWLAVGSIVSRITQ